MYASAFVLGFHGCDQAIGEKILRVHVVRQAEGRPPFDSVRGPFIEGEPLYDGAGIMARTHIQVCVRSVKRIRGYFRPIADTAT